MKKSFCIENVSNLTKKLVKFSFKIANQNNVSNLIYFQREMVQKQKIKNILDYFFCQFQIFFKNIRYFNCF